MCRTTFGVLGHPYCGFPRPPHGLQRHAGGPRPARPVALSPSLTCPPPPAPGPFRCSAQSCQTALLAWQRLKPGVMPRETHIFRAGSSWNADSGGSRTGQSCWWPGPESRSDRSVVVHRRWDPDGLLGGAFSGVQRDLSYSSRGKKEDSLGRACVGPPRDNATAHRTSGHGRRSSCSSSTSTPKGPPRPAPSRDSQSTRSTSRHRHRTPTRQIHGGWGTSPPPPPASTRRHHTRPPRNRRRLLTGRTRPATRPGPANGGAPASPARRTRSRLSRFPQRHRASTSHLRRSQSPRRRHDPSGPRSRRSRYPGRRHGRHRRPLSTSPSPNEQHRASCSPRRPYASSTLGPRRRRSRTSSSEPPPPPPQPPPTLPGGLPPPCGSSAAG